MCDDMQEGKVGCEQQRIKYNKKREGTMGTKKSIKQTKEKRTVERLADTLIRMHEHKIHTKTMLHKTMNTFQRYI